MKKVVARSSELVVLEHAPGENYELVSADHEYRPVIGIFFTGDDARELLARLEKPLGPSESDRTRLRRIRREALRNIDLGRPKL